MNGASSRAAGSFVVQLDALGLKIRVAKFFAFSAEIAWDGAYAGLAFYEVANEFNPCSFVLVHDSLHYAHQAHEMIPRPIDPPR
jgi:hypothetical protein